MAESRHPADANDDMRSLEPRAQTATDVIDEMQNVCENLVECSTCTLLGAGHIPPLMPLSGYRMHAKTLRITTFAESGLQK